MTWKGSCIEKQQAASQQDRGILVKSVSNSKMPGLYKQSRSGKLNLLMQITGCEIHLHRHSLLCWLINREGSFIWYGLEWGAFTVNKNTKILAYKVLRKPYLLRWNATILAWNHNGNQANSNDLEAQPVSLKLRYNRSLLYQKHSQ